jgi:hypothetical protein
MFIRGPLGESLALHLGGLAPTAWGPHAVGGAEPGAERR